MKKSQLPLRLLSLFLFFASLNLSAATHPRLFFDAADLSTIRSRATHPVGTEMLQLLKDQYVSESLTLDTTTTGNKSRLAAIAGFLYLMTSDEQYALQSYEYSYKTIIDDNEPWAATTLKGLTSYWSAYCVSFAYDWCYNSPSWSVANKSFVSNKLMVMGDMIAANGGTEQNTNAASNWQGIRGASALLAYLATDDLYSTTYFANMKTKLYSYVEQNYGNSLLSSGWNIEGLGYQFYPVGNFIGPVGIALERVKKEDGLRRYASFISSFWTVYATLSTGMDLGGFGGFRPDFGDDNPHVSGEGVFGQSFYYLPEEMKPAAKYCYDKAVGSGRATKKYDGERLGLIWSFLYYPFDVVAENPASADSWKSLMQDNAGGNGYYTYRNQYKDGSDELAQLYVKQRGDKGHAGPDALSFRILGSNSAWAIGGGRYGKLVGPSTQDIYWHLMNTVYPVEPLVAKIGSTGCTSCKTNSNSGTIVGVPCQSENGSGHIISEMAINNVWTTGHKRWFVSDYDSLNTGCRAFYLIADSTVNGKYWHMVTAVENTITTTANSFTITAPNGSSMQGTVFMAGTTSFKTGTSPRGSTYGVATDSKYITLQGSSNKFLVALSIVQAGQIHPLPTFLPAASISASKVTLSNKSYTFTKDNVLYNNSLPTFRPQALWNIDFVSGQAPLQVNFSGVSSFSPSSSNLNFEINSGDNQTAYANSLTHTYSEPGVYQASIKVTDTNALVSKRFAYIMVGGVSTITSVEELPDFHFNWYCENSTVHINFQEVGMASEISCYDLSGRMLISQKVSTLTERLDLKSFAPGVKIVKVRGVGGSKVFKIVI